MFPWASCEGGFVRPEAIGWVLDQLADPRVQLYGVFRPSAYQPVDYVAVYADAWDIGDDRARFAIAVMVRNAHITSLLYSCGTPDPAQLAQGSGSAVLAPVPVR